MNCEIPAAVRRLLDLETAVDDEGIEGDDDEEENLLDDFINDEETSDIHPSSLALPSWSSPQNDEAFEEVLSRVYDTLRIGSRQQARPVTTTTHELVSVLPCKEDSPLYRVKCRIGVEEYAILSLLECATVEHQLCSAFTRGSIRGWIYLESTMNRRLVSLLETTPGIIQSRQGITCENIPRCDWIDTLRMRDPDTILPAGKWVRIRKGIYREDVGVVARVEPWGAKILLLPRFKPPVERFPTLSTSKTPSTSQTSSSAGTPSSSKTFLKRKRGPAQPAGKPVLFDPVAYERVYGIDPKQLGDSIYSVAGCTFEHGLIRKEFDFHSVSTATNIPLETLFLYIGSKHPLILSTLIPCPPEWDFQAGDEVVVRSSEKQGVVVVVAVDYAEVELTDFEGQIRVPWSNIYKKFVVGDFVTVTSGLSRGKTGWVVTVEGESAFIVDKILEGEILIADPSRALDYPDFHVNLLKKTTAPFVYGAHLPDFDGSSFKPDKSPWLGLAVIIIRGPFKGYYGTVKNVLLGQSTISGQRIEVQLSHMGGTRPFAVELFDHDDIVETSTRLKLLDFDGGTNWLVLRNGSYAAQSILQAPSSSSATALLDPSTSLMHARDSSSCTPITSTSMTPAWDSIASTSLTPAWDPSSRTPIPEVFPPSPSLDSSQAPTASPVASTSQQALLHPLFDRRLLDISLQVIVNGGEYKKRVLTAALVEVDGRLSIRRKDHHKSKFLEPEWVSFKNPSATRDNGLLVVIKGDHCGKLVRRIYHRKLSEEVTNVILAVVKKEGGAEVVLEERLELHPDSLCVKVEDTLARKAADALMDPLREGLRKRQ